MGLLFFLLLPIFYASSCEFPVELVVSSKLANIENHMFMWIDGQLLSPHFQLHYITDVYNNYYRQEASRIIDSQNDQVLENVYRLNYVLHKTEEVFDKCKTNLTRNSDKLKQNIEHIVQKILLEQSEDMTLLFWRARAQFVEAENFTLMIRREVKVCKTLRDVDKCLMNLYFNVRTISSSILSNTASFMKEYRRQLTEAVGFTVAELEYILRTSAYATLDIFSEFLNCVLQKK